MNKMAIAAILVGGFGTRLRSVVSDVPKPLAPIQGKPFLFFILEALASSGIKEVILLTGYMHEKIFAACGSGEQFGLNILYSHESSPLGTAGALKLAENLLRNEKAFLLLNGDSFCSEAISALAGLTCQKDQLGVIAVSAVENAERFGTVDFDRVTFRIRGFREKSFSQSGYVNAGVYLLSTDIFSLIEPNQKLSLEQDIFPKILALEGQYLSAVPVSAKFDDIGLPESYYAFATRYS